MDVVKCENGHFFDGEQYDLCPHCGAKVCAAASISRQPGNKPKKQYSIFGNRNEKLKIDEEPDERTVALNQMAKNYAAPSTTDNDDDEKTVALWQAKPTVVENNPVETQTEQIVESGKSAPSLKEAVQGVAMNNEGKTVGIFSAGRTTLNEAPSEPVVGWLVCISGAHFGESFTITAGKNSIGRAAENDVVLRKDASVSRLKHSMIIYEPKKRNFYLQPGDSSGLTYLNEEYIMEPRKMNSRDIVELGDTKLMFVPLCGEEFTWEDYIQKG